MVKAYLAALLLIATPAVADDLPTKRDIWKAHTKTVYSIEYDIDGITRIHKDGLTIWTINSKYFETEQYKVMLDGGTGYCHNYAATNFARVKKKWPGADVKVYEVWYNQAPIARNGHVVVQRSRTYHAVAVVKVGDIEYIMDNTTNKIRIKTPSKTPLYEWVRWTTDFKTWHPVG